MIEMFSILIMEVIVGAFIVFKLYLKKIDFKKLVRIWLGTVTHLSPGSLTGSLSVSTPGTTQTLSARGSWTAK